MTTAHDDRLGAGRQLFDDLVDRLCLADPAITRSTMMGYPCVRVAGAFAASLDHHSGDLIVKLPRDRVAAMVASGEGEPFAPAGRVFREWVAITDRDERRWGRLVDESVRFVAPS